MATGITDFYKSEPAFKDKSTCNSIVYSKSGIIHTICYLFLYCLQVPKPSADDTRNSSPPLARLISSYKIETKYYYAIVVS